MKSITAKKRKLTLFVCLLFLVFVFLSGIYAVREVKHECTGNDCPVCACLHGIGQTLKQLGTGALRLAAFMPMLCTGIVLVTLVDLLLSIRTPVSQKIRMNN